LKIINSLFEGNQAILGCAIYLNSPYAASITNNTFNNNSASRDGGAILFGCFTFDCEVNVTENVFFRNIAEAKGGALQYYNTNFTEVTDNTFIENEAYYGSIIGSFPARLELSNDVQVFSTIEVSPGHTTLIVATIYDQEGRVYTGENRASARLEL
jgi:predicted outer membrane repeat protein